MYIILIMVVDLQFLTPQNADGGVNEVQSASELQTTAHHGAPRCSWLAAESRNIFISANRRRCDNKNFVC